MSTIPRAVHNYQILQSYGKGHLRASCTRHHSWRYRQTAQSTQGLLDYNLKHINQSDFYFVINTHKLYELNTI
jgi:hypothetical protein